MGNPKPKQPPRRSIRSTRRRIGLRKKPKKGKKERTTGVDQPGTSSQDRPLEDSSQDGSDEEANMERMDISEPDDNDPTPLINASLSEPGTSSQDRAIKDSIQDGSDEEANMDRMDISGPDRAIKDSSQDTTGEDSNIEVNVHPDDDKLLVIHVPPAEDEQSFAMPSPDESLTEFQITTSLEALTDTERVVRVRVSGSAYEESPLLREVRADETVIKVVISDSENTVQMDAPGVPPGGLQLQPAPDAAGVPPGGLQLAPDAPEVPPEGLQLQPDLDAAGDPPEGLQLQPDLDAAGDPPEGLQLQPDLDAAGVPPEGLQLQPDLDAAGVPPGGLPLAPDAPGLSAIDIALLKLVKSRLDERLPSTWISAIKSPGIQVGMRLSSELLVVQRSAFFAADGRVEIGIHGKRLGPDHDIWANVRRVTLNHDSVGDFLGHIMATVDRLRSFEICLGVQGYRHLWKTEPNVEIDTNPFQEYRYSETCRSKSCQMLVPSLKKKRCADCSPLWKSLNERNRTRPLGPEDVITPPKKKPHKFLNTPEKAKRLHRFSAEVEKLKHQNQRLMKRMQEAIDEDGVPVNDVVSDDILKIFSSEAVAKLTEFQKIFVMEQVKSVTPENPRGRRWHPAMLRLAISLHSTSPAAYEELSGVLNLPSKRQLYNYTHVIEAKDGVYSDIIEDVAQDLFTKNPRPYQLYHVVSFDEMYIKKNLVFLKKTGELIGYVKLNEVDEELRNLENVLSNEAAGTTRTTKPKPPLAEKILCYMVKGTSNDVEAVVACYSVANLNKEALYFCTWEVIGELELRGLRVIALACDGASTNQGFYQMLRSIERTPSGIVFVTRNHFSGRPLFLINDPGHLLKTARNNVFYSGKISKRKKKKKAGKDEGPEVYVRLLTKNKQVLKWETVVAVYNRQKESTLKTVWKLNKQDVDLNSYSMMSVPFAAHVLSKSMATQLRQYGWDDSEELAVYCETVNAFFDMVNGVNPFQAVRSRNLDLAEYRSIDDPRFARLLDVLRYFEDWKKQVQALRLQPSEKAKRFISAETFSGMERTIRGFIGAVQFVLGEAGEEDTPFVNAQVFSSERMEKFFSKLRGLFGSNRHPDLRQAQQGIVKQHARATLGFHGMKKGNVGQVEAVDVAKLTRPKSLKKRRTV